MPNNNSKAPVLMAAIAVASVGAGAFVALGTGRTDSPPPPPVSSRVATATDPLQAIEAAPQVAVAVPDPSSSPTSRDAAQPPSIRRNRMARDVKREQIWSALRREHQLEPAAAGSAAPNEDAAKRLPELDREYIRSAITEQLLPVAIECYESALADDPALAGNIVAEFTIVGSEEVGGVVEEAVINADESTLDSEFVRECMRESLLAVTFEPPPDGGQVKVTYPFTFSP
jgi:hypothetical protein